MKKILYNAIAAVLVACSSTLSAEPLGAAISREQKQLLQGIIERLDRGIHDNVIIVAEPDNTRAVLSTLRDSLGKYSCELGCICDTLRSCISRKCVDLAPAIEQCLAECAQRSENPRELTPEEYAIIQDKISKLTEEFFMFQIALLGKVDYVLQDFLQRYHLETYGKLATPFALFTLYFMCVDTVFDMLKARLNIPKNADFAGIAPKIEGANEKLPVDHQARGVFAALQMIKDFSGVTGKETKYLPTLVVAPAMIASSKKIKQHVTEFVQQKWSALTHRKISSLYPVKKARFGFEAKPKYAHLKTRLAPVIDFCSKLRYYRTIDVQLTRGYILQGDLKDGRDLGEAIAGELAKRCKEINAPNTYGVYDLHASKLLTKDIAKIMEECNEYGPAVLVINDIGWLCEGRNVKPHKYAEIINELTRATLQNSNSSTLVILTTRDSSKLERLLQESYRFTVIDLAQTF